MGRGAGGAKPGLVILRNQNQTHINTISAAVFSSVIVYVLLVILPLYNLLLFLFSSKIQEHTVLFTFTWLNL